MATDGNGQTVSQTFTWIVNPPVIAAQGAQVNLAEGVDPGPFTIATFTTPDMNSLPDDFFAVINWGDGATGDAGAISGGNGSFTITGDHIYAEKGSYTVTVQIGDSLTGGSATVSTTATVADAPLTISGGFEFGDSWTNPLGGFTVAVFTDANPSAPLSDYSVSINWGDGGSTTGSPGQYIQSIGPGYYAVVAPHSYNNPYPNLVDPLVYTITVTITDVDGASASTSDTVEVGVLQAGMPAQLSNWGFLDQNSVSTPSDFVAQGQAGYALLNWGDGTSSLGTVNGSNGGFTITATHTFPDSISQSDGRFHMTPTVTDDDGNTLTGTQFTSVVRPDVTLYTGNVDIPSNLTVSNAPVAVFTVPDGTDAASEYSAQINWGDGSSSGTIQGGAGMFEVLGSHTYAAYDWYTITVTISQGWGGQAANTAGAGQAGGKKEIVIRDASLKNIVDTLNVGRWINAFAGAGKNMQLKKGDFIAEDPDCFYVRVKDDAANKQPGQKDTIKVYVDTSSDSGHWITLTETGLNTGVFQSPALLLTTFAIDKQQGGNQTLNVQLGDTVRAIYGNKATTATVPIRAVVTLHINILRIGKGGQPATSVVKALTDVGRANRIYAAAGILLVASIDTVDPPAKVDLTNGLLSRFIYKPFFVNSNGKFKLTPEEQALLGDTDLRAKQKNVINVYYLNYLAVYNNQRKQEDSGAFGESFYPLRDPDPKYDNSIIISANDEKDQTLAHEIGHVLLNDGDHTSRIVYLMTDPPQVNGTVTDSRRIIGWQMKRMLKSPLAPPPK